MPSTSAATAISTHRSRPASRSTRRVPVAGVISRGYTTRVPRDHLDATAAYVESSRRGLPRIGDARAARTLYACRMPELALRGARSSRLLVILAVLGCGAPPERSTHRGVAIPPRARIDSGIVEGLAAAGPPGSPGFRSVEDP